MTNYYNICLKKSSPIDNSKFLINFDFFYFQLLNFSNQSITSIEKIIKHFVHLIILEITRNNNYFLYTTITISNLKLDFVVVVFLIIQSWNNFNFLVLSFSPGRIMGLIFVFSSHPYRNETNIRSSLKEPLRTAMHPLVSNDASQLTRDIA